MLVAILYEVPHGKAWEMREIGKVMVANDCKGDDQISSYYYQLSQIVYAKQVHGASNTQYSSGSLKEFERSRGAWALIKEILEQQVPPSASELKRGKARDVLEFDEIQSEGRIDPKVTDFEDSLRYSKDGV